MSTSTDDAEPARKHHLPFKTEKNCIIYKIFFEPSYS
jgi:hypothetical protein